MQCLILCYYYDINVLMCLIINACLQSDYNHMEIKQHQDEPEQMIEVHPTNTTLTSTQQSSTSNVFPQRAGPPRKKYGNLKVLLQCKWIVITVGPDWLCFLAAFLMFSFVSYGMIRLVNSVSQGMTFIVINYVVCVGQCLSYLMVALSNPGVVFRNPIKTTDKPCSHCGFYVPRHARHCKDCDICVQHYDHHCPWTSKCIGGGNLKRFYLFLGWTPVFFIYTMIAFMICMAEGLSDLSRQQLQTQK